MTQEQPCQGGELGKSSGRFWRLSISIAIGAAVCAGAAAAQTPTPPAAKDFANAAAQSDQYEIMAAHDAIAQSQKTQIRTFAQQMIEDHVRTEDRLRQAAQASGLPPPPPAMSADQAAMLSALQGLRGVPFDQAYARQQVLAHRQALAVEQSYAVAGDDPNLRPLALSAVPLIQHHLEMAEQIVTSLSGS